MFAAFGAKRVDAITSADILWAISAPWLERPATSRRVLQRMRVIVKAQHKLIVDIAAAQEVFATRQHLGEEVVGYAYTLKVEALAAPGGLVTKAPKATGTRGQLKGRAPAVPSLRQSTLLGRLPTRSTVSCRVA